MNSLFSNSIPSNQKLVVSFSSASQAERGNLSKALEMATRTGSIEPSWQMILGKEFHKCWQAEIQITKKLPRLFESANIEGEFIPERYRVVDLGNNIFHSGVCDLEVMKDGLIQEVVEFKTTGSDNSVLSNYLDSPQAGGYTFGTDAKKVWVIVYNYLTNTVEVGLRLIDENYYNFCVEYFVTWALEIKNYAINSGLRYWRDGEAI